MRVHLSHFSALRYWREWFPLDEEPPRESFVEFAADRSTEEDGSLFDVIMALDKGLRRYDDNFDVLFPGRNAVRALFHVTPHCWTTPVPSDAFLRIGEGVYVASPEFVFVQLASTLDIVELVALGMELCGLYVLAGPDRRYKKRAVALTSVERLRAFVEATTQARGHRKALRALRFIVGGSTSPRMTELSMLMCMSPMLGGYGFGMPEIREYSIDGVEYGVLCWDDAHVAVLCDEGETERIRSGKHVGDLDAQVFVITDKRMKSIPRLEKTILDVAMALGKRERKELRGSTENRLGLRHVLFRWSNTGGQFPTKQYSLTSIRAQGKR